MLDPCKTSAAEGIGPSRVIFKNGFFGPVDRSREYTKRGIFRNYTIIDLEV